MAEDITGAYNWAIGKCNEEWIGYSQYYRNEVTRYWEEYQHTLTTYDCSSFIWYSLLHNGFDCVTANGGNTWPFTTTSMPTVLPRLGYVQINQNVLWKPMDIVLTPGSHTELVYTGQMGGGVTMGAHSGAPTPLAAQVSINSRTTYAGEFTQFWRYTGGSVQGYEIWMLWTENESMYNYLDPEALYINGDAGKAYGLYQFDYRWGLVPFMQSCYDYNPTTYSGFLPFIQMGAGNENLKSNSALHSLFQQYATNNFDEFQYLQDKNGLDDYLFKAVDAINSRYGYDIMTRDPVIIGSLFSMAIRAGYSYAADCFPNGNLTDIDMIVYSYNRMAQSFEPDDAGRWLPNTAISQYDKAMNALTAHTDIYVLPYGGFSPSPIVVPKTKLWLYQKNRLYQRRLRHERFR